MKQHRSYRGCLCSQVKAEVFKEFELKPINVKSSLTKIKEWKSQPKLKKSFLMLFKQSENGKTHIVKILEKLWPKSELKNVPEILISYTVRISEVLLNLENKNIQITEQIIKLKIMKNLRDIVSLRNNTKFF